MPEYLKNLLTQIDNWKKTDGTAVRDALLNRLAVYIHGYFDGKSEQGHG